jgi:hypothetical protein
MDLEGELRLLRPARGDLLALYVDTRTLDAPETVAAAIKELRGRGVVVVILPRDALLTRPHGRTAAEVLDEWLAPHGYRAVPR